MSGLARATARITDMGRAPSDAELIEASRRGEQAAFGELVTRYQGVVCAVGYSGTRDRALSEDVAQDTFLAAWRQLDQLRETERLRSWLCGIARNLARKARKRSDREQPVDPPPGSAVVDGSNPFDRASEAETERVVRDALARVPDSYREVLVLYYHEHRSIKDVADVLGISEAAVMQRMSRGRHYLAEGVNDLVERALRGSRVKRNLAACVLAAIPALGSSRVDAATGATADKGWTMLKLALFATATMAVGTTAVVVHHSVTTHEEPAPVVAATTAPAPRPEAVHRAPAVAPMPALKPPPAPGPAPIVVPEEPAKTAMVDRATLDRLHLEQGPSRGPANAPVTIVVFTDMKCPFCEKLLGTLDQLEKEQPAQLRVVIKQFPVHETAILAAEATFAADAQGKFWDLYDPMFAHRDDLSEDAILKYAQQGGLDVGKLRDALDHHTYADAVAADQAAGKEIDVNATPTFLINGKVYRGALPIDTVRDAIKTALGH
jgi:RNA polymerase sigma factor (sigma-70 family)